MKLLVDQTISITKTKSSNSSNMENNQLLEDSLDQNHHHVKPKRKAPARPSGNKTKIAGSSSSKPHSKVKKKTVTSSQKEEGEAGGHGKITRKISPSSVSEENTDEVKDAKLRRIVSPRKEQYSHLLDEMVGCGDMVLLEPLTEDNIIENLKKRYTAGDIYVRVHFFYLACHNMP